jgi:transposase-like protein
MANPSLITQLAKEAVMTQQALEVLYNGCNGNNFPDKDGSQLRQAIEKRNAGRESEYSPEKALIILQHLQEGKTVEYACSQAGISKPTFYHWKRKSPDFLNEVTQAHEDQADSMVDDNVILLENVDETGKEGMAALRKAEQIARFKFDLAKCLNFKKYGDKKASLNVNLNGTIKEGDAGKWFNK